MESKTKKRILVAATSVFAVSFFAGVMTILAVNDKIDLSGVPVVGKAIASISQKADTQSLADPDSPTAAYMNVKATPSNEYTSPADIQVTDGFVFVADETGMKVQKVAVSDQKVKATYEADDEVHGVYVNGDKVYALVGGLDGRVIALNKDLKEQASMDVGHTPVAMVVKGTTGYVANKYSNDVTVLDLGANKATAAIEVGGRQPMALEMAGGKLFVATHLPNDAGTADVVSADLCVIDTATNKVEKDIPLINGAGGVKDLTVSPDGSTIYVAHVLARYSYPTTQLDRGWINTNAVSIIDVASETPVTSVLLDEVELGASNPWGIRVTPDGKKLVVALSGTQEAMVIDIDAMNAKIDAVKNGNGLVDSVEKIPDYLPFLDDCRTRIALPGNGARSLEIVDNKAYIGQYYTGDIAVLDLATNKVDAIQFAEQPADDAVRTGERLWNDANYCYQKWESCASCHPDARVDGFNWDNLNDGLGNPKSAKSMLYSHRTPPVMVTGIRATAEVAVRAGMQYIQFNTMDEAGLTAIDEYMKSLQPVPSPYLNRDGSLTESAERGKVLFEQNCASCHPAPLYTDMKLHDHGTNNDVNWENRPFDTPSLVEVWRTGPWNHDGSVNDIRDIIRKDAPKLTDDEVEDLYNYVMSIGDEGEDYGVEQILGKDAEGADIYSVLKPGSTLTSFTVRRQQEDAGKAKAVFEICDPSGKSLQKVEKDLGEVAFNTAVSVDLKNMKVPADLAEGSYIKISILDASSGDAVASDLIIKY